jgi:Xaa-Pro aminopeptidase
LEIHANPSVSKKVALKAGKMITIEPGSCFGGIGGVRMEDVVFARAKGFEFFALRKLGWSL